MVNSVLSPEKIVGRQNKNKAAAQNFISGGSILGTSVVNSAANKIVGFQRAGIQPKAPAIDNIISTISTNINNNVNNTINNTLQSFSSDYQRRIQQIDSAKPVGILNKFLNVYKTSLGFIQFFGNKKTIDKVRDNLEALKKSFTESFEVAKLIRQVIIKIVKQLSNLPVASPSGGGGLNLDIDIPGGGLKRSSPRGLGGMMKGKGKMLALGAGALGLGALGAGAVNALSDSPQEQAAVTSEIPENTIDRFSSIVDRFANAISNLFKTQKPKPQQKSPGFAGTAEPPKPPGPPGEVPTAGNITGSQAEKETKMFSYLKEQVGENAATGILANAMRESGYRTDTPDNSRFQGMFQWSRDDRWKKLTSWAKSKGLDPMDNGTQLQYALVEAKQSGTLDRIKAAKTPQEASSIWYNEFERAAYSKPITGTAYRPDNPHEKLNLQYAQQIMQRQKMNTAAFVPSISPASQVAAAPSTSQARQQIAQQVAQPPASQQMQPSVVMPIDLSGVNEQQQSGGGGISAPPSTQKNGPSVPLLPATNTDNFLVLYSRMVYNIVDG